MRILRNYILAECVLPFFISISVLTCVFLLGYLPQLADKVINKGVSLTAIGQVFLYYIPLLLGYTLPISCLTTIILTFGRLSADNEILAMRANGIYLRNIISPLVVVGIIFSIVMFILNDRVIPQAYNSQNALLKQTGFQNPAALLEAGTFINAFDGYIIFIYKVDGNKMHNIRIYQPPPKHTPRTSEREFQRPRLPGEGDDGNVTVAPGITIPVPGQRAPRPRRPQRPDPGY